MFKYFTDAELACKCGEINCSYRNTSMNDCFMNTIISIREHAGFPFVVTSALRCPAYNKKISSSQSINGPHTTGRAIDILCNREKCYTILELAFKNGMTGIFLNQKGADHSRFIHLDNLTSADGFPVRPTIGTY